MSGLIQDLKFALRSLTRAPGFTVLGVSILALGIGATAAIFSVTHALLLKPLPYKDADRLMLVWQTIAGIEGEGGFSWPTFEDLKQRNRAFESMGVFIRQPLNASGDGVEPERLEGLLVSAEFSDLLGIEPAIGRSLRVADDRPGAERTVMLSHEVWSRRFGGDEEILSRSIKLNDLHYSVVGVMPPKLSSRRLGGHQLGDFWIPVELFRDDFPTKRESSSRLLVLARLRSGNSPEDGRLDVGRIGRELAAEYPLMRKSSFVGIDLLEDSVGEIRPMLYLLLGAVVFVLIVACANLANLLLVRGSRRRQEFATRMALGAGRLRLARQVLTETLVIGLVGGAAGLLLARSTLEVLAGRLMGDIARNADIEIGPAVLVFSVVMIGFAIFAAGSVPALQATKARLHTSMRAASARQGVEKALVGLEIAVALVLLIGAFLMLSSLLRLQQQDPGFDPANVLSAQVTLTLPRYAETESRVDFFDRALTEIGRLPGVRSVAMTSSLPMVGGQRLSRVAAGDRPLPPTQDLSGTRFQLVSPGFFASMGIPLLGGRDFSSRDDDRFEAERVVIINQTLAEFFWPDPDDQPLGRPLAFELKGTPEQTEFLWREVIGIVGDVRHTSLKTTSRNSVYIPYTQSGLWFQNGWPTMALVAKTDHEPGALAQPVRAALSEVDPAQPIHGIRSLDKILDDEVSQPRSLFRLLTLFAALALVLALVGVYGVVAQAVAQNRREIGTRVALGATPGRVLCWIMGHNMLVVAIGLVVGLIAAAGVSRSLASLLYGIEALDPLIYGAAAAALAAAAAIATLIPAWQAMRIDPSKVLHED